MATKVKDGISRRHQAILKLTEVFSATCPQYHQIPIDASNSPGNTAVVDIPGSSGEYREFIYLDYNLCADETFDTFLSCRGQKTTSTA